MRTAVALIGAMILFASQAVAQDRDPAWLDALTEQLARELSCELAFIVRMQEGTLGAQETVETRVQCVDGRRFDANRIGAENDFVIKPCGIEVC